MSGTTKNMRLIFGLLAMGSAFGILAYGASNAPNYPRIAATPNPIEETNCERYADWKANSVKVYPDKNNPTISRVAHPPKEVRLRWEKIAYENGCEI